MFFLFITAKSFERHEVSQYVYRRVDRGRACSHQSALLYTYRAEGSKD